METPQTTEKLSNDSTDINQDGKISVPYTEYKALIQGFQEERKKMEDRMWLDVNLSKLDEVLRNNFENTPKKFSENLIQYLARLLGAIHGAFFVVNHDKNMVQATAGYACTLETMERTQFQIGEGLVGQAVKSQEMLCLDEIETEVNSSLGKIKANYMVVLPLAYNKTVSGVIELSTLDKLMPRFLIFLDRASHNISASLQSLLNAQKTKEILMDNFEQSEIYKDQQKEIKVLREENQKLQAEIQAKNLQQQAEELEPYYIDDEENRPTINIQKPKNTPNIVDIITSQSQAENNVDLEKIYLEKLKALEAQNLSLEMEKNELIQKNNSFEDLISKKNNDVSIAKEALKWKNDILEKQDEEISNLKNAISKIQLSENQTSDEKDATKHYIHELQLNITFWQNMVTELSEKIANTTTESTPQENIQEEEKAQEKEAMQQYINDLQANLNFWQEKAYAIPENWEQELHEAQQKIIALQHELEKIVSNYDELEKINTWQAEKLQNMLKESQENTEKYNELEKINTWQAEKLQNILSDIQEKEQLIVQISQQIATKNEIFEKETHYLRLDLDETLEKNGLLSQELQSFEQKYKDLITQFENTIQKLRKKEDELLVSQYLLQQNQPPKEDNLQELQDLKELVEELKQKNNELEENFLKIQAKKAENTQITQEITNLQTENQNYQAKINALENQILTLNETLNQQKQQTDNISQNIVPNTVDNFIEIPEIAELLLEIAQLKEKHQKDTISIQSLENQIADIEEKTATHWQEKQNSFNEKLADLEIIQEDLVRKKEFLEQTANMLNQRERELVELFDKINAIFAVLEISPEGEILSANQKFLQLTRLQGTELIGQTYTDFLDKNFAESKDFKVMWEGVKVGIAQNVEELAFISTKGEKSFYHTSFIPIINKDNQVTEIVHLFNHLMPPPYPNTPSATIVSMAEDRVKALESSLIIIEVDMEGTVSRINQQAIWALGYKEGEILACPFTDLLDISEKESDEYQEWQAQIQQGISTAKVVKYVGKEGEKLKFRTFFYPLRDENKNTKQWLACLQKV